MSNVTVNAYTTTADQAGFHRFQGSDADQELTDESIKYLTQNKIEHVISLNSRADDKSIKTKLQDNNIQYTPLPVEDFHAPTLNQLKTGHEEFKKHSCGTLVWCGFGHGRTGTMVSALQIYAEQEKERPSRLSHADYKKNHVEAKNNGETTGQYEVLDKLQDELAK
ncbi:hypothetical protein F4777DRAFT_576329 [Nemania sp. FL0916]|nr:hypothetical protein F4777DRAFT_576329 [Nemania sp. FL0916]